MSPSAAEARRYLLDTILLIWAVRNLHGARELLQGLRGADTAVSAISLLELRRALAPEEHAQALAYLEGVAVLPLDGPTAAAAGDYLARCWGEGYRVDLFAGIIAVTAARGGRALVTYAPAQYPLAPCELVPLQALRPAG